MTQSVSPRDARLLSDYIDGQLKPRPRVQLEARLEVDADLRQALDDMARTCQLLRKHEPLRAPRNFTLTPAMVRGKKPAPPPTYPVFGLVSAVTALLLILVLAGDWLSTRGIFLTRPETLGISQVMSMEKPIEAAAVSEEEMVVEESLPELTAEAEAMKAEPADAQPMLEMSAEVAATATPGLLQAAPGEQPEPSAKSAPATSMDESAWNMAPAVDEDAVMSADAAGMGASVEGESYPYPEIYPDPELQEQPSNSTLFGMPRSLLTVLEILLGAAAVGFLVLFLLRRVKAR